MAWGRYSGYFFHVYEGLHHKKVGTFGPFATRDEAEDWKKSVSQRSGKVFQKERPVYR